MSDSKSDGTPHVCLLTAPGRSALCVLAVQGLGSVEAIATHFRPANAKSVSALPLDRVFYGHWGDEDLIVCRTAEDGFEIHCHGGSRSSARILQDLTEAGCLHVDSESWIAVHTTCSIEAEAQLALASATTERTARHLLHQCQGALQGEIEAIQNALEGQEVDSASAQAEALLSWKEFGLHLTHPWRIVICGRPNVGKSSLINSIAGYQRVIVYDQPGTTRDVVSVETALEGWPVELSDTAGMHEPGSSLESEGIRRAKQEIQQADLLLWVLDAGTLRESQWHDLPAMARQQADEVGVCLDELPHLIVVNKIDLVDQCKGQHEAYLAISAIQELGLSELLAETTAKLIPQIPPVYEALPFTSRQMAGLESLRRLCQAGEIAGAMEACDELLSGRFSSHL